MKLLRRELAPLTERAWKEIDDEARNVLVSNLSCRRFVDVEGPQGWSHSAVNLGRVSDSAESGGVRYAVRRVQPLVELRVDFVVSRSELDNLDRGANRVDVDPVREAALRAAHFEEAALHHGLAEAGIRGLREASEHARVTIGGGEVTEVPDAVTDALMKLTGVGVVGPYVLVLGPQLYRAVSADASGYPLRQQLIKLVGSTPVYSPVLAGGLVVSTRGGDFSLTLGADFSIGFDRVEGDAVHLFLVESFTFRVIGEEAIVVLE